MCFAFDHVAYDCHALEQTSDCSKQSSDGQENHESSCLDLRAAHVDAPVSGIANAIEPLVFNFCLATPLIEAGKLVCLPLGEDGDDPPTFCARSFCCSIALRC